MLCCSRHAEKRINWNLTPIFLRDGAVQGNGLGELGGRWREGDSCVNL